MRNGERTTSGFGDSGADVHFISFLFVIGL